MRGNEFFAELSKRPPFTKLHPQVASFFKDCFAREKVIRFGDRFIVNTHFPPYPSAAFDNLVANFSQLGDATTRRLYSVTWGVTNRCPLNCWHCYNAGRSQDDLSRDVARRLVGELQDLGAVMVTLTGGEPLLREDLEELASAFDERACLILGTSGVGFTADRARRLRNAGVFGVGISLDSMREDEHDRLRGHRGAFRAALKALERARHAGLYAYVVSVATREFLQPAHFQPFLRFASQAGALEVHLLEPSATGRLAGQTNVLLTGPERRALLKHQADVAGDETLPILSAYAYLESAEAFGCGAGLTHLYVDGSGEVCPCQLVPHSFGNVTNEPLTDILDRMGQYLRRPRAGCIGRLLAGQACADSSPTAPAASQALCERWLPREHPLPTFFRVCAASRDEVGAPELRRAYDRVHDDYDEFWLAKAGAPIDELIDRLSLRGNERAFEAGCGTGYATVRLAARAAHVHAVDLSDGMLSLAQRRVRETALANVSFEANDALAALNGRGPYTIIFSSWVLGYIPLEPFFAASRRSLERGGRLAFIVHKEDSPAEPLEIFAELVAEDPSILTKRVAFDFPRDAEHVHALIAQAGLVVAAAWEGAVEFCYQTPVAVLDHLLKSGAGTAFYDALDPARRDALSTEFLRRLAARHPNATSYPVRHDYVGCIASSD